MAADQRKSDSLQRGALVAALLLALGAAQPAAAQLPRPAAPARLPAVVLDTLAESRPLTLAASHVDVEIVGAVARLRSTLVWRNDGALPVTASYQQPLPGRAQLRLADDDFSDCADAAALDEAIELGDAAGAGRITVAAGAQFSVVVEREAPLLVRGDRHRLVLPLPTQRHGAFTPQFSADVLIDAARPIVALASATHDAQIERDGENRALLAVHDARGYEGRFFAVEFTLGEPGPAQPDAAALALAGGHAPAGR